MIDFKKYANVAQESLDYFYISDDEAQFMNNIYPLTDVKENEVFNYWWLAHLVDIRLDAYLRTKKQQYLDLAENTYQYNKNRNHGTLMHEFYDDMLWNGLAALRLYEVTKKVVYLQDAKLVCTDIFKTAWNEKMDGGFAWKRTQLYYKNTPVNGPIMILALRLHQIEQDENYLETSLRTLAWMQTHLVNTATQFVEDGINRNGDGRIDTQWRFTYNQGVYIGALLEFYHVTNEEKYLEDALKCAQTSIDSLTKKGVFCDVGDGGDIGLFKGIEYRYLNLLYQETKSSFIKEFIESSCEILVQNAMIDDHILAYRNWQKVAFPKKVFLADQLSGVMALESAASLNNAKEK